MVLNNETTHTQALLCLAHSSKALTSANLAWPSAVAVAGPPAGLGFQVGGDGVKKMVFLQSLSLSNGSPDFSRRLMYFS